MSFGLPKSSESAAFSSLLIRVRKFFHSSVYTKSTVLEMSSDGLGRHDFIQKMKVPSLQHKSYVHNATILACKEHEIAGNRTAFQELTPNIQKYHDMFKITSLKLKKQVQLCSNIQVFLVLLDNRFQKKDAILMQNGFQSLKSTLIAWQNMTLRVVWTGPSLCSSMAYIVKSTYATPQAYGT